MTICSFCFFFVILQKRNKMNKIKISDYHITELPYFKEDDPNSSPYQDFYKDVDLLQLVNKMSHITLKKPEKTYYDSYIPSDWHICHQFAFFYNHGSLLDDTPFLKRIPREALFQFCDISEGDSKNRKKELIDKVFNRRSEICRKFLKPEQDEVLNTYRKRFFSPQIIASLCAFNIDIDQFWYMFLFTIDHIYRKTHHVTEYYPTALQSFDSIYALTSDIPQESPTLEQISSNASVIFKYGKQKITIENDATIKLLGNILHQYCEKHRNECDEDVNWCSKEWISLHERHERIPMTIKQILGTEEFEGWRNIKAQTSMFLFRKYMKDFFKNIKGKRNLLIRDFIEDAGMEGIYSASIDVELLIARLAWAAQYFSKFPDNKDYLKSLLKKFRPDEDLPSTDYHWLISVY